jgi:hypothetical protein
MTAFFLYHQRSQPTGSALAAAMQLPHGLEVPERGWDDVSALIRWGSRYCGPLDDLGKRALNPSAAIARASDKLGSLSLMREAGVNVPDFDTDPGALVERAGYPILGRRRQHARATDVVLCLQRRDWLYGRRRDYYVAYVPTTREYRVHVVGDEVIRVQGKYLDVPRDAVAHVRNFTTGYRFRAPNRRLRPGRLDMAVLAVKSLGLDFGAVDLLVGDDGQTYILEVNTAPSCSPRTAVAYANAFCKLLEFETEIDMDSLSVLSPDQEERDTEDEVPGED